MAFTLSYPRCYPSDKWYSLPNTCGGLSKQFQHFVKFTDSGPTEEITGWIGDVPTAGFWQGPPNPAWETSTPAPVSALAKVGPSAAASFSDRLKEFFEMGNNATKAAKIAGYATIALVGGGLLLWYVPRKKK